MPRVPSERPSGQETDSLAEAAARQAFDPWSDDTPDPLASALEDAGAGAVVVCAVAAGSEERDWSHMVSRRVAEECATLHGPTLLFDLDLEQPALHEALAEPHGEGISDVFHFSASLSHVARPLRDDALSLVPAGTVVADPEAVLRHEWWDGLLRHLRDDGTTPVLHVPSSALGADAVLARADVLVLLGAGADAPEGLLDEFAGRVVWLDSPSALPAGGRTSSAEVGDAATGAAPETGDASLADEGDSDEYENLLDAEDAVDAAAGSAPAVAAPSGAPVPESGADDGEDPSESGDEVFGGGFAQESADIIDQIFTESDPEPAPDTDSAWTDADAEVDAAFESFGDSGLSGEVGGGEAAPRMDEAPFDRLADESDEGADEWRAGHETEDPEWSEHDANAGEFAAAAESDDNPFASADGVAWLDDGADEAEHDAGARTFASDGFDDLPVVTDSPRGPRRVRVAVLGVLALVALGTATVALTTLPGIPDLIPTARQQPRTTMPAAAAPTPSRLPAAPDPQVVDPLSKIKDEPGDGAPDPADGTDATDPSEVGQSLDADPSLSVPANEVAAQPASDPSDAGRSTGGPTADGGGAPRGTQAEPVPPDPADPAPPPAERQAPATPPVANFPDPEDDAEATRPPAAVLELPEPVNPGTPSHDPDAANHARAAAGAGTVAAGADPGGLRTPTQPGPTGRTGPPEADRTAEPDVAAAAPPAVTPAAVTPAPDETATEEPDLPAVSVLPKASLGLPPFPERPSGLMAFGIVVRAYWGLEAALERRAALEAQLTTLQFIVSPVDAEGAVLYRVVGGPAATVEEAEGILVQLQGLLGQGAAEAVVTPTRWTYLLGVFEEHAEARERVAAAAYEGIPAYLAEVPVEADRVIYRVYAGAFATEREARALGAQLAETGLGPGRLTERTGRPAR